MALPHLKIDGNGVKRLYVRGKPFLCRGGELQNSSSSSARYMASIVDNLKRMNLNTLFISVSWEQIEPQEDTFDFKELDAIIELARDSDLHLILLWFGSYKNGMSTYVPGWVKQDVQRFPRSHIYADTHKKAVEVLSPFSRSNWQADAKAFGHLMQHVGEIDSEQQTVILVQVENEPGILGGSRDVSTDAEAAWQAGVPDNLVKGLNALTEIHPVLHNRLPNLLSVLRTSGRHDWVTLFGREADEIFMANAYSSYIGNVAEAGKEAYALPFFVNAWLSCDDANNLDLDGIPLKHNMTTVAGGGNKPGDYPCGGCTPQVLDIWRINARNIDVLSPDIYLHKFDWVCEQYVRGNEDLLLVPEMRRDEYGARRILYAHGQHNTLAISPFGVDTLQAAQAPYTRIFDLLRKTSTILLSVRPGIDTFGFFFDEIEKDITTSSPQQHVKVWGDWRLKIERAHVFGRPGPGCGIIVRKADDQFFCMGWGYSIFFESVSKPYCGILRAREIEYEGSTGRLIESRWLNGDETRSGTCLIMPNEFPDEGGFPIPITIPARTAMATCTPYAFS